MLMSCAGAGARAHIWGDLWAQNGCVHARNAEGVAFQPADRMCMTIDNLRVDHRVTVLRDIPSSHEQSPRKMIVPPAESRSAPLKDAAYGPDGPDQLTATEEEMRKMIPQIGAAAYIAEMYARRMRAFQSAGNEPRAIAAFKLAVAWMATYASWATSGGEGDAFL